jgi:hypothetical protein
MTGFVETGTVLDRILARTALDMADRKRKVSPEALERLGEGRPAPVAL